MSKATAEKVIKLDKPVPGPSPSADDKYRILISAVVDYAIYMLDPNGVVATWNPGAERFKGYTEAEIVGQHFSTFYSPEDRAAGVPEEALQIAAQTGKYEREGWRLRRDGSRFWAHVVIDPIRARDGTLVGYAKITRDLTERRAAERELRKSEERFRLLVQGVTDYAIYMLDPDGRVANWNAGAQRIKGYAPDEIIGEHFSRFYTEEDRQAGEPARSLEIAATHGRLEKEAWRIRKDGTRFWANVVIDAIRDENGDLLGFAKVTRDITERLETQQALQKARESLFQSQKMEAIGRLTGGVAHDFNNLLMAVLGSLELLEKRLPPDPKMKSLLHTAVEGARRGASLTQRMLAFARRQDLKSGPVNLPDLLRGMTELVQTSLGGAVAVESDFPLVLPKVLTDENQLELAILNLLVNAKDAMPDGGTILVSAREEIVPKTEKNGLKPGRYVCLSVADNGQGMDESTLAKATEPFFTTKGVGKGTGLGLSMVHGLAEQSGGRLLLKSQLGKGTSAEIWLPVAASEAGSLTATQESHGQSSVRETRPLVVLAVDDDHLVLLNTVAMLDDLGHKVFQAASGKQALQVLEREQSIELVITDMIMPDMNGAELSREIRARRPDLAIVLATGYAEFPPGLDSNIPRLAKPFRMSDLARSIANLRE